MNSSSKTQTFFTSVVTGDNGRPSKSFVPFQYHTPIFAQGLQAENFVFDRLKGNFDEHIACSIPLFREAQLAKIHALRHIKTQGFVLDIGGSEGTMLKTLCYLSPHLFGINLDPNRDMCKAFAINKPKNSEALAGSFLEGFHDGRREVKPVITTSGTADIVNETMTFQFIKKDRKAFVKEVSRILKPDGIFVTEEKFTHASQFGLVTYLEHEELKDNKHKSKYFDKKQITLKAEQVLTGMAELQAQEKHYYKELQRHFKSVARYWKAGNFAGYVCSNSPQVVREFLNNPYIKNLNKNTY